MKLRLTRASASTLLVLLCVLFDGLPAGASVLPSGSRSQAHPHNAAHAGDPASAPPTLATVSAALRAAPLAFEPNVGQTDARVRFLVRGPGYRAFLTDSALVLDLASPPARSLHHPSFADLRALAATPRHGTVLRLSLLGATTNPSISADGLQPNRANYFIGRDPAGWHTGVPRYARVTYHGVYPGIDLLFDGGQGRLEYSYLLAPGADASAIQLGVDGAESVQLDAQGALVLQTAQGPLVQPAPVAYQQDGGQRQDVAARYVLLGGERVGLALGAYNTQQPLVIDPVLSYSTYLGGSGDEDGESIAVDSAGNAYVTGPTSSTNFPTTTGAYSTTAATPYNAFVAKLNAAGSALVYSTYLGGSGNDDAGQGIAVDSAGDAYVAGWTNSTDFPTKNAYQSGYGGGNHDAFVAKLNPSGSGLVYSTYLGGSGDDLGAGIALDSAGDAYVTGVTQSSDYPHYHAAQGSNKGNGDAFVTVLNAAGSALVYSTYLGGTAADSGTGIAVDGSGDAYVTGDTASSDFITTTGAYSTSNAGGDDAFVTKLDPTASGAASVLYSTYLGGSGADSGYGIAVDGSGDAYVTGATASTDFPTKNAVQGHNKSTVDNAFASELNPSGNALVYSTYLGGGQREYGYGIAVDASGDTYLTGETGSTDFPTVNPVQAHIAGSGCTNQIASCFDAYVSVLSPGGGALTFSTYLGGSNWDLGAGVAVDAAGNTYVTGAAQSSDFPTTPAAFQTGLSAGKCSPCNAAFVTKLGTASSGLVPWHPHQGFSLGAGLHISVDLADGHADVGAPGMTVPGRGPDLSLNTTWDSTLAAQGFSTHSGQGWRSDLWLRMGGVLTGTVVYTDASGAQWPFVYTGNPNATGPYTSYAIPPGQPWQLTTSTAGFTLSDFLSGQNWTFSATGAFKTLSDAYGNTNSLTYTGNLPITETNSGGRALGFAYNGNNQLSDATSPLWRSSGGAHGQHVTYGYAAGGVQSRLTQGAGTTDALTTTFGYSGTQLVTITTPAQHIWTIAYDALGRVSSVTSPVSGTAGQAGYSPAATTQFSYSAGQTQVVQGSGSTTPLTATYTLDGVGEPVTVTDGLNDTTSYSYDADHDVLSTTDANQNTTTNAYLYAGATGSAGLVTQTVQPAIQPYSPLNPNLDPVVTKHAYDPATYDLISTTLPEGGLDRYFYDGHHSVVTSTELLTGTTVWRGSVNGYDAYGQLTSVVDGRGLSVNSSGVATFNSQAASYTRAMTYDTQGDQTAAGTAPITTTLNGVLTANAPVTTTYGYDGDGDQTNVTTPNGNSTGTAYDHLARPVTTTLPPVQLYNGFGVFADTTVGYDGEGHVITQTDANGAVTTSSYDPQGRLVATTNPVSGTTIYTYSATEQTASQDPVGNVTTDQYDAAGRLITATAPISGVTQYQYDPVGNTTAITTADASTLSPIQVDTRQYDALNRVITDTISGPTSTPLTTATRYDHDGNTYQVVYPAGNASVSTYNLADQLLSTENDTAAVLSATHQEQSTYNYDAAGNQVQAIDFGGNAASTTYDGDNRVAQALDITSTSTVTTSNQYDPNGNVLTTTIQAAQIGLPQQTTVTTATYNAQDWQTSSGDNGLATSYGYDAAGQLRTRTTAGGTITTTLDAEGRITAIGAAGAGTTTYGYNADDQPITASLPGSLSGAMSYDRNGQLSAWSLVGPSTGVTTSTVNLAYTYGYNAAQQVSAITLTDNNVAQSAPVTHDAQGRLTGWVSPNGPNSWGFDGDGDVISTTSYINGALRTTVFTYSNTLPKQLVQQHTDSLGVDTYSYDGNGNVVSEVSTDPITSPYYVNQHYWYDAMERPITVTNVLNGAVVTATLGYNAAGQNITYTAAMSGQVIDSALYSYDSGGGLLRTLATTATLNGDGSIQSSGAYTDSYAYDPLGQPLYLIRQENGTTNAYTYITDGHGSVVGLADSAGNRVDRYQYAPYGAPVGLGFWETVPQLFRNNGTMVDPGLGLNDPDGNLTNLGSGTTILANKGGGYFSYSAFGDDPLDFGTFPPPCSLPPTPTGHLLCEGISRTFRTAICYTFRQCVDQISTASAVAAIGVVWFPGGQPVAAFLGTVSLVGSAVGTGMDAIEFFTNPRARTTGKKVGLFLDVASIAFSRTGEKLVDYALVNPVEDALNAARSRGASETITERLQQELENSKLLSSKISKAIFEPKALAIDIANQQLAASLEQDTSIVTGPEQTTVSLPSGPGVISGRLYLYLQVRK